MMNSMEYPLSNFTQLSLHHNLDCDLDFSQELHTVQENSQQNYNDYYYQKKSEQSASYHTYNLQSVLSSPTQSTLPTQNFSADSMPFVHQNNELNSYTGTVNEAAGSCFTNEAVVPTTGPTTTEDWTLTILGGPDHGKVMVAQECPWAADVNIINPPTVDLLGDMHIGQLTPQLWNEHAEINPSYSTHLHYESCNYVNTDDNISIYRVDESEQPGIIFEIGGGVNVQEFTPENETCDSYRFELVTDDKENKINDVNLRKLSTDEQNKFVYENELKNYKDNNTYPLTENNQKHAVKSTYKCGPCNKTFTAKCYLTQHNNSIHSELKLFKCDICGKRFANAVARNKHVVKHSGDKPKKCSMCSKSFNHEVDLQRHILLHTGTKPHRCEICSKGFVRNDHMLKHMETHGKKTARNRSPNSFIINN